MSNDPKPEISLKEARETLSKAFTDGLEAAVKAATKDHVYYVDPLQDAIKAFDTALENYTKALSRVVIRTVKYQIIKHTDDRH